MKIRAGLLLVMLSSLLMFSTASAEEAGCSYRALVFGIDAYRVSMPGGSTDSARIAAMLQSANEGGAFYQAPNVRIDVTNDELLEAFSNIEYWGVEKDDVTFFFYSGAAVLESGGAKAGLLLQDEKFMPMEELSALISGIPGSKIVVLNLVYPSEKMRKTGHSESELVTMLNDTTLRAFQNTTSSEVYLLCFTSGSDLLDVISSIKDEPFGLAPYFLTQACGYDYLNKRPCDLLADANEDGAVSLEEARVYVREKVDAFLSSSGISDLSMVVAASPIDSDFPIIARRKNTHITRIEMDRSEAELAADKSMRLGVQLNPPNASDKTVAWSSSDLSVATVDQLGNVQALRAGDVVISATASNGLSDFCTIKVRTVRYVESMKMNPGSSVLFEDSELQLKLTVQPDNANEPIIFSSSDESVATVSQSGLVAAVGIGQVVITASTEGENPVTANCEVSVAEKGSVVERIELREPLLSLFEGGNKKLDVRILPEDATDKSVTWNSSDENVASVTQDGVVMAIGKGTCSITATSSSGLSAVCKLTVRNAVIEFKDTQFTIATGDSAKIEYRFIPEDAKIDIEWMIADEEIATVSGDGLITGKKIGETAVTANLANGGSSTLSISVTQADITSLKMAKGNLQMVPGQVEAIEVEVKPESEAAQAFSWTSSNAQVATVDESGKVYALADGKTEIIALSKSGKTDACRVEVKSVKASKVELNKSSLSLALVEGLDSEQITATVSPENAMLKGVTWKSENEKIARVSEDGVVTAVSDGKTVIRATSLDGNAKANLKVIVEANRVAYDKPLSGSEPKLYTSAKRIYYDKNGSLVVDIYFYNKSNETLNLPKAGTLYLQLAGGEEVTLMYVPPGNKQLKSGKTGTLTFTVKLSSPENEQFRNLDLRAAQATIRTSEEDAELQRMKSGQTNAPINVPTGTQSPVATQDQEPDFVNDPEQ